MLPWLSYGLQQMNVSMVKCKNVSVLSTSDRLNDGLKNSYKKTDWSEIMWTIIMEDVCCFRRVTRLNRCVQTEHQAECLSQTRQQTLSCGQTLASLARLWLSGLSAIWRRTEGAAGQLCAPCTLSHSLNHPNFVYTTDKITLTTLAMVLQVKYQQLTLYIFYTYKFAYVQIRPFLQMRFFCNTNRE